MDGCLTHNVIQGLFARWGRSYIRRSIVITIVAIIISVLISDSVYAATSNSYEIDIDEFNVSGSYGTSDSYELNDSWGFIGVDEESESDSYVEITGFPALTVLCGNGIIEPGEACDDGNFASGDGCSDSCTVEVGDEGEGEGESGSSGSSYEEREVMLPEAAEEVPEEPIEQPVSEVEPQSEVVSGSEETQSTGDYEDVAAPMGQYPAGQTSVLTMPPLEPSLEILEQESIMLQPFIPTQDDVLPPSSIEIPGIKWVEKAAANSEAELFFMQYMGELPSEKTKAPPTILTLKEGGTYPWASLVRLFALALIALMLAHKPGKKNRRKIPPSRKR